MNNISTKTPQKIACHTLNKHPAGWDDEDLEVGLVFKVTKYFEGEENPLNTLYSDNRGRFFLAKTERDGVEDAMDMPGCAFHEISFEQALKWAIHAQNNYDDCVGTTVELLEHALKLIGGSK